MSKKRKPIDLTALSSVAIPQGDPVAAIEGKAAPRAPKKKAVRKAASKVARTSRSQGNSGKTLSATSSSQQASRLGKVGIQFWTNPETRKALRHYATETECTMDALLNEAIQDLMNKHKIA